MKTIRIGNDFTIEWTVTRMGEDSSLEGLDLHLYIDTPRGRMEVDEYLLDGNRFRFLYPGSRQLVAGVYGLTLTVNEGKDNMSAVDACKVFRLVESGCSACGDALYGEGIVVECNSDIIVPANGMSAYEIAVLNGFQGTEAEWVESLKKPAEDAAEEVREQARGWQEQEDARQKAERGRVAAENRRVENENQRVASEQERVTAEQGRAKAESVRQSNERARQSGEDTRKKAETARDEAEKKRASDEEERQGNETARKEAETKRDEAEQARAKAEQERGTAETERSEAEKAREEAESKRKQAESARVSAEQQRVSEFSTLKQESRTATEAANEAADNANGAAALANVNTLAIVFDDTTGKLDAVTGADGSAFTKGEITTEGNVVLTFDY